MTRRHPFDPTIRSLPGELPIFPLTGVLLLPGGQLPLNVFEMRYLNLVADALGRGRLIGLIQPRIVDTDVESPVGEDVPVYSVGCMGRITAFRETDDGRYLISLRGLIRFAVAEELPTHKGFRRVRPDFDAYAGDLAGETSRPPRAGNEPIDRARLIGVARTLFTSLEVGADWPAIERTQDDVLVTTLAMACPLPPGDRQALLECPTAGLRAKLLIGLIETTLTADGSDRPRHH